ATASSSVGQYTGVPGAEGPDPPIAQVAPPAGWRQRLGSVRLGEEEPTPGAEPRWPPALALLVAMTLYATLPDKFISGSTNPFVAARWVIPTLGVALLVALAVTTRRHRVLDTAK